MASTKRIIKSGFLLGLVGLVIGCVVAPREGYYDRAHARYYREHAWHDCIERDPYCR